MNNYKYSQSRLARKETQRTYKQLFGAIFGIVFLLLFIIFAGLPALVKFSAFIGDVNTSNQPIVSRDNNPLLPPQLEPIPDATNKPQLAISGYTQSGKEVEIFLNDQSSGKTTVGSDGKFTYSNLILDEGENRIRAYTVEGDKKSEASKTLFITYKKGAPKLEISKPDDGASFSGDNKTIRIEGNTDPDTTVTVNDRWAIVSSNGNFYVSYTLSDGENVLKIKARDQAGNETTLERKVNYSP